MHGKWAGEAGTHAAPALFSMVLRHALHASEHKQTCTCITGSKDCMLAAGDAAALLYRDSGRTQGLYAGFTCTLAT